MITKDNEIPHQYARVGEAFSFQFPANTFSADGTITYEARVARKIKGISLSKFWIDFDPITRTFSGNPLDFDDEGARQIEVTATDSSDDSTAKAYFTIITYPEGSTTTTVLPRTSAECDFVLSEETIQRDGNNGEILFGEFVPFEGMTIGVKGDILRRVLFQDLPEWTLITNVDGVASIRNGADPKALVFFRCNNFKVIGQAVDDDPVYGEPIYGLKVRSGSEANKVLPDYSPDPSFNFGQNNGGTAIEIEAHSKRGIEVSNVHVPFGASAGIKIRTKFFKMSLSSGQGNIEGSNTFTFADGNFQQLDRQGWFEIAGDRYEYSDMNPDTQVINLVSPLTRTYAPGETGTTASGIRFFHDMEKIIVRHNLLENIDTEGVYMGEGFFTGNKTKFPTDYGLPADIRSVRLEHNIFVNNGYDPIQVKNSVRDVKIRYNYCFNNSYRGVASQKFGLFVSDGTNAEIAYNYLERTNATGLRIYVGNNFIHHNIVIDSGLGGLDGSTNATHAIGGYEQGGVSNAPITEDWNLGGYFLPQGYNSTPELGTSIDNIKLRLYNNTFVGYGEDPIVLAYSHDYEFANNLFVGRGVLPEGEAKYIDLGGNLITENKAEVSFISEELKDYRVGISSIVRGAGVDVADDTNNRDYNANEVIIGTYSGALLPDGDIDEDNFNYLVGSTAFETPYHEFSWFQSDEEFGTYEEIFGEIKNTLSNLIDGRWYKQGIRVKDKQGNEGNLQLSNAIQYIVEQVDVAPTVLTAPTISGAAQEGNTLTAVSGTYDGTEPITITRFWQRDGVDITDEEALTYLLASADVGADIRIRENASNSVGNIDTFSNVITNIQSTSFEPSTLTKIAKNTDNNSYGYIEYLPQNYSTKNDWELIIWIHGGGEDGDGSLTDLDLILDTQISNWLNNGNDIPYIVVSPQGDNQNFPSPDVRDIVIETLAKYSGKYNPEKIHLAALSAGTNGIINLVVDYPDTAALLDTLTISSRPGSPPQTGDALYLNTESAKLRVWLHHGDADTVGVVEHSETYYTRLLESTDPNIHDRFRLTTYQELGHSAWDELYDGSGVTKPQNTGSIGLGQYYLWELPETWYTWMTRKDLAVVNSIVNDPIAPPQNSVVNFSAVGSLIDTYSWNFGDGSALSTLKEPSHTYTTTGEFTVTLTVTNKYGDETVFVKEITVISDSLTEVQRIKVNFDDGGTRYDTTWNHLGSGDLATGGRNVASLTNTSDVATGIGLDLEGESFTTLGGAGTDGAVTGDDSGIYPDAILSGNIRNGFDGAVPGILRFKNLDPTKVYTFKGLSSRATVGSGARNVQYTISGINQTVNSIANTSTLVSFENLLSDENNEIIVTLVGTSTNNWIYLNACELIELE